MLFSTGSELIRTSDRIIISYFLGIEQLGYYGIAIMAVSSLIQIPGAAREVIEPRLMQNLQDNSREENLREYFFKPLVNSAYLLPVLLGPLVILLPWVIPSLLSRYIPGIRPAQILILGSYFFMMSFPARGIIVANNWQRMASMVVGLVFFLNTGLSITLIKLGFGLNGVAIGSSISFFLLFVSLLFFVLSNHNYAMQDWKPALISLCWPFPIMCISLVLLEYSGKFMTAYGFIAVIIHVMIYLGLIAIAINIAKKRLILLKDLTLKNILQL